MPAEPVTSLPTLPARPPGAHKGDFGRVLVVGGSRGMSGAVALATNAALRGGAGLVTFAAPETVQLAIAPMCPCAMSAPLPCQSSGGLSPDAVELFSRIAAKQDVIAMAPGMAVGELQADIVGAALAQDKPVVLDADGLNNLADRPEWPLHRACPLVLTPHPGEFARLTDLSTVDIQADRQAVAVSAVLEWQAGAEQAGELVCVLKGAGTVVTDGRRVYVNDTGNPGMATGGSGDVLTGLIAALIGQGLSPFDAACLGVWAHGRAGDLAAARMGQTSLIATDLLDDLPAALAERAG